MYYEPTAHGARRRARTKLDVTGQRLAGGTVGTEQTKLETKADLLRNLKNEPIWLLVCGGTVTPEGAVL